MLSRVLAFLRNEGNRALLASIGGGVVALASGLWAVFTVYVDHTKPPPRPTTTIVEQKGTGIASGRDTNINAPVTTGANVKADSDSVPVDGNVSNSTITIGVPPEKLDELVRSRTKDLSDLSESQRETNALLKEKLDLTQGQVKSALESLGEANVPPERLGEKLSEIARKFKELKTTVVGQSEI